MRKVLSKISLAAVLVMGCQLSAQASVTELGLISGTKTLSGTTVAGAFTDYFNFTVGQTNMAGLATTSILFPTIYGTLVQGLNLYAGTFSDSTQLPAAISLPFITSTSVSGGATTTTLASSANLTATGYTLVINGTSLGNAGYTGIIALTAPGGGPVTPPVPEPETYAMLLAGLGMLGFIARRRQKNS